MKSHRILLLVLFALTCTKAQTHQQAYNTVSKSAAGSLGVVTPTQGPTRSSAQSNTVVNSGAQGTPYAAAPSHSYSNSIQDQYYYYTQPQPTVQAQAQPQQQEYYYSYYTPQSTRSKNHGGADRFGLGGVGGGGGGGEGGGHGHAGQGWGQPQPAQGWGQPDGGGGHGGDLLGGEHGGGGHGGGDLLGGLGGIQNLFGGHGGGGGGGGGGHGDGGDGGIFDMLTTLLTGFFSMLGLGGGGDMAAGGDMGGYGGGGGEGWGQHMMMMNNNHMGFGGVDPVGGKIKKGLGFLLGKKAGVIKAKALFFLLSPILVPVALLILAAIIAAILAIPIPVINAGANNNRRSAQGWLRGFLPFQQTFRLARSVLDSEQCVERVACELAKNTKSYVAEDWTKRKLASFDGSWAERISAPFATARSGKSCEEYKCEKISGPFQKIQKYLLPRGSGKVRRRKPKKSESA